MSKKFLGFVNISLGLINLAEYAFIPEASPYSLFISFTCMGMGYWILFF